MGAGGSTLGPPPGRLARSPATIVRRPVRGSTRTSGKGLLHRDVLDPGLDEPGPARAPAVVGVEVDRVRLRVQDHPARAGRARLVLGHLEQLRADAPPAVPLLDREAGELHGRADPDEAAGREDRAVLDGHEVEAVAVAPVE